MRKVFRYVDDYLFLLESPASELLPDVDEILAMVKRKLAPLEITFELPVRNGIRFFGICFVRTPINTNNKYKRYDSLTELLRRAELPTIGQRAKILRPKFLFQLIHGGLKIPSMKFITPSVSRYRRAKHGKHLIEYRFHNETFKYSYFSCVVREWNSLPNEIVTSSSLDNFASK